MILTEFIFWFSILAIFYAYFGYPMVLWMIVLFKPSKPLPRGVRSSLNRGNEPNKPTVSFIITAYNEERRIAEKIENALNQDYPKDSLKIIVASDCSTDRTDEIVKSYESKGVRLVRAPERKGKENAQKCAVDIASGEVLVFSDVATILRPDGITNIVKNFNDPTVGCVSSVDRFINKDGKIGGEGAYVKYEMFLRKLETKVNTLVGLSGSFFAARKEVCENWPVDLQSDFNTLLNSVKSSLRGISDPESIGYYENIVDEKKEFERKVRTVLRGISVFMKSLPMLNPFRYGLFSWQLFSHKLCRWLAPFAMILAFFSNAFLVSCSGFYLYTFIIQFVFYSIALYGMYTNLRKNILKIPSFFVLVNLSILNAWYRYLRGERMVRWNPSER